MKKLLIGRDGFKLPLEAVTQTFAVLAIRGAGKTNTCVVIAEEMLSAGAQVVVVDPTNSWWGLRSSVDGKSEGFPITVLGGDHGDLPLESTAGKVLAEFVVHNQASAIFSVRHMSKGARYQFVADFGERLFQLKDTHRTPMHLILDEADRFVPQRIQPDQTRMFGAVDDLVRLGRSSGIGVSLISQRAAVINKDVLSQTENLICLRTIGKHDRDALEDWAEAHSSAGEMKTFMDSLASLDRGEAWIWSPFWLKVFERVHIRMRNTFDSSATPEFGKVLATPKHAAHVDLEELRKQMALTIERAKAEDPRELKKKIAELTKQLKAAPTSTATGKPDKADLVAAEQRGFDRGSQEVGRVLSAHGVKLRKFIESLRIDLQKPVSKLAAFEQETNVTAAELKAPPKHDIPVRNFTPPEKIYSSINSLPRAHSHSNGNISSAERRILTVLAQCPDGVEIDRLAALARYTVNGHFNNVIGGLRTKQYITPAHVRPIRILEPGAQEVGEVEPLPTGRDLQQFWMGKLTTPESRIMGVLFKREGDPISIDKLAEEAGYTVNGHFNNIVGGLRTKGLMTPAREPIRAAEVFFE